MIKQNKIFKASQQMMKINTNQKAFLGRTFNVQYLHFIRNARLKSIRSSK